jgi:hypothetical protein
MSRISSKPTSKNGDAKKQNGNLKKTEIQTAYTSSSQLDLRTLFYYILIFTSLALSGIFTLFLSFLIPFSDDKNTTYFFKNFKIDNLEAVFTVSFIIVGIFFSSYKISRLKFSSLSPKLGALQLERRLLHFSTGLLIASGYYFFCSRRLISCFLLAVVVSFFLLHASRFLFPVMIGKLFNKASRWKLTVVLDYYEAMETYSRIELLRSYGNSQSYWNSTKLCKLTVVRFSLVFCVNVR